MQWSDRLQAGFTSGEPWLKVNPNYRQINVQAALADPNSIFYTYQKLIRLRHENEIVVSGSFKPLITSDSVLAYYRELGNQRWLIVANLSESKAQFTAPDHLKQVLLSNYSAPQTVQALTLKPYEAFAAIVN